MRTIASISVLGEDRTGVVARITGYLFEAGGNIESLEEQVRRGQFHMALLASWDGDVDRDAVEEGLRGVGADLGMEVRVRWQHRDARPRMGILVTKEPHALEALLEAVEAGRVEAEPVLVIGNRPDLAPLVDAAGVPFEHVDFDANKAKAEERVLRLLDEHGVDLVVLARFMRILSPAFCWRWRNKMINIHPSLLPAFPGASAYRQAYEHGVRVVGVTAHFVTPDLDQGPIIHQEAFNVGLSDDYETIRGKGQELEGKVLVEAVRLFLEKRLDVHWGRVWEG